MMRKLRKSPGVLVIGAGNPYRRDDGVGIFAVRKLKSIDSLPAIFQEQSGEGSGLLESFKDFDAVILIDAVSSGATPGKVYRFNAAARPLETNFFRHSTHAFGISQSIELARALNQLPKRFIVYGVEGECFEAGEGLSTKVAKALEEVIDRVHRDIKNGFPPLCKGRAREG